MMWKRDLHLHNITHDPAYIYNLKRNITGIGKEKSKCNIYIFIYI